ncbi:MAG TPA: DUF4118 domain-containing protein, partial [Ktedonobacterales bacterium]|nr:DUF4118 domain-containing protein [Ktedonobacterales bacterium]
MKRAASKTPDTPRQPAHPHHSVSAPGKYLGVGASWFPTSTTAGVATTVGGWALALAVSLAIDHWLVPLTNPGWLFLPVVALIGYRWGWRLGALATAGELLLVWYFFTPPRYWQGLPGGDGTARLLT